MTRTLILAAALAAAASTAVAQKDKPAAPPTAKERQAAQASLRQIGLAIHNYHDAYGHFPADVVGKDGKPLLSWRVAILPFLEEDQLYKSFKVDEAWDSTANKKLIEKLPKVYAPARGKAEAGRTFYQGFAGPGTMFEPGQKLRFSAVTDGLSNTALVVDAGEAVEWSKPADLPYDPDKPLPKLGGQFDGAFYMLVADGSVRPCRADPDEKTLRNVITRSDGNVVDLDAIAAKK
jgi:hypothetical protein